MKFQKKVRYDGLYNLKIFIPFYCPASFGSFFVVGSDGAASSYHVKQLEEQNGRLKEALVRSEFYLHEAPP